VVQRAWKETQEHFWLENWKLNEKGEDFTLAIEENDLFVAVLRVLQWFAQREDKVSTEAPSIDVEYSRRNDRLQISFTDQSRRLGSELRQRLFEPFTQIATSTKPPKDGKDDERPSLYLPLYLAKTLIDTKNKGLLEDRTDELPNDSKVGHRFTISFPAKEDNATT
jgi:K+-sensing histidine kinase KdpD